MGGEIIFSKIEDCQTKTQHHIHNIQFPKNTTHQQILQTLYLNFTIIDTKKMSSYDSRLGMVIRTLESIYSTTKTNNISATSVLNKEKASCISSDLNNLPSFDMQHNKYKKMSNFYMIIKCYVPRQGFCL